VKLEAGQRILHYQLEKKIDAGGMGEVWRALDTKLRRTVAIKVIAPHLLDDPEAVPRFFREARAAAQLSHPNVVTIHEINEDQSSCFLVMEYLSGGSLAGELERVSRMEWLDAADVLRSALRGIRAAHAAGLVHRDLKPSNLMRSREGVVKVVDFGVARLVSAGTQLTGIGQILGSPHYIAPEQCEAPGEIDHRADLYSLGCTFYTLLTGTTPYEAGDNPALLLYKHVNEDFPDPRDCVPGLPDSVCRVIARAVQKNRDERFQSADEMLRHVEALLDGPEPAPASQTDWARIMKQARHPLASPQPVLPVSAPSAHPPKPAPRRRRGLLWAWAAGCAVVVALVVLAVMKNSDSPREPARPAVSKKEQNGKRKEASRPPVPLPDDMVEIPAGTLRRGAWDETTTAELLRRAARSGKFDLKKILARTTVPARVVTVAAFDMDSHEVTNAEYARFLKEAGGDRRYSHGDEPESKSRIPGKPAAPEFKFDDPNTPVTAVDWFDAYAYARWKGKRLPTEDEWELAARGEGLLPYPWGRRFDANFYAPGGKKHKKPWSVDALPRPRPGAPLGLASNVQEWTTSPGLNRSLVHRGVGWHLDFGEIHALAWLRFFARRDYRGPELGFRCVSDPLGDSPPEGMLRIPRARVRLGGDESPLLDLARRHTKLLGVLFLAEPKEEDVPAFFLDRHEVTNAEYRRFLEFLEQTGDHSACHPDESRKKDHRPKFWEDPTLGNDAQPVVGVDYYDAFAYAAWAKKRLPSTLEWERAARGDDARLYPWGERFDKTRCVCAESGATVPAPAESHPSGASPFGLLNLVGNVAEWTATDAGAGTKRLAGGSWKQVCETLGLVFLHRHFAALDFRDRHVGFRCAR